MLSSQTKQVIETLVLSKYRCGLFSHDELEPDLMPHDGK